jgi:CSLREA domain-containing protein
MLSFIGMAIVHAWDLLFLPPQTSFERFHSLDVANGYSGSYTGHRRWKHNVRFGALSYSLVLITAVTFTTTVVQLLGGGDSIQVAFAATQTVNSTDDVNDGACNVVHCSLREAINAVNATPDQNLEFDS